MQSHGSNVATQKRSTACCQQCCNAWSISHTELSDKRCSVCQLKSARSPVVKSFILKPKICRKKEMCPTQMESRTMTKTQWRFHLCQVGHVNCVTLTHRKLTGLNEFMWDLCFKNCYTMTLIFFQPNLTELSLFSHISVGQSRHSDICKCWLSFIQANLKHSNFHFSHMKVVEDFSISSLNVVVSIVFLGQLVCTVKPTFLEHLRLIKVILFLSGPLSKMIDNQYTFGLAV